MFMNRYAIQKDRRPVGPGEKTFSIIKIGEGQPVPEGYELLPEKKDGLLPQITPTYSPGSKYIDPNTFEEKTVPTNRDEILERAKKVTDELNG